MSLDFLRGLIMVLLVFESTRLYDNLFELSEGTAFQNLVIQFFHHPWHGLRFWGLDSARIYVHCRYSHGLFIT